MTDAIHHTEITWLHRWTDHLFSFRTTRPPSFRFTPGQFARLGLASDPDGAEPDIWRAYSLVSGPYDEYLEFLDGIGCEFKEEDFLLVCAHHSKGLLLRPGVHFVHVP